MTMDGIPKSEIIWLHRIEKNGDQYYITSKEQRDLYFIYKVENGKAIKLGKGKSPPALEETYIK